MQCAELVAPGQPLVLVTREKPSPPKQGCLVRTVFAGICHSDNDLVDDIVDLGNGLIKRYSDSFIQGGLDPWKNRVLGHEIAGIIESFGTEVDPEKYGLSIGDRVMVYPWIGCGDCSVCQSGFNNLCENNNTRYEIGYGGNPGGFSTHVPVPRCDYVFKVPDGVPMDVACMLPCSGLTAYGTVVKAQPYVVNAITRFGEARVLIIGAGGLGLWAIQHAKVLFKGQKVKLVVSDINQESIDTAIEVGADEGVLWNPSDAPDVTASKTTHDGTQNFDAVLDFVSCQKTVDTALECLHRSSIVVIVGTAGGLLMQPLIKFLQKAIVVQGTVNGHVSQMREVVELVSANAMSYPYVQYSKLADINETLHKLRSGKVKGRALIKF